MCLQKAQQFSDFWLSSREASKRNREKAVFLGVESGGFLKTLAWVLHWGRACPVKMKTWVHP